MVVWVFRLGWGFLLCLGVFSFCIYVVGVWCGVRFFCLLGGLGFCLVWVVGFLGGNGVCGCCCWGVCWMDVCVWFDLFVGFFFVVL